MRGHAPDPDLAAGLGHSKGTLRAQWVLIKSSVLQVTQLSHLMRRCWASNVFLEQCMQSRLGQVTLSSAILISSVKRSHLQAGNVQRGVCMATADCR